MRTEESRNRIGIAARALFFTAGLCVIIVCLNRILIAKNSASKMTSFFEKQEDYDVLFVGISHMKYGVYPMELWQDYGIASFNLEKQERVCPRITGF